ncbi:Fasciclin-domain-containing protein [Aulographum hederae CBS 113979]|uniref:Fasciclin-domain-containing protein n=1 Tax=Aulographum hederae CBS 113979 TaxID=1176131 RepID=A0A6G1GJP9_9PEZI|nr:Fasciclin-domain-containing protein [Aulographum hederae CBS 113979]
MLPSVVFALCLSLLGSARGADALSFDDALAKHENTTTLRDQLRDVFPDLHRRLRAASSSNPVTFLAPSNDAFAKTVYYPVVGPAFSNNDEASLEMQSAIMTYHVVLGKHTSDTLLPTFQYFPTWLNNATYSNVTGGQRIGGVMQREEEMIWTSGIANRSPVTVADIEFEGGVIHIVDSLAVPPQHFPDTAITHSTAAEPFQLTSFLGATYFSPTEDKASNLSRFLNDTTDLTIFAPNNVALERVASALSAMSKTPSTLADLLEFHIVRSSNGPYYSTNLTNTTTLTTINGKQITVTLNSNSLFADSARVITPDLLILNGVMHVIDAVLSPNVTDVDPNPKLATASPLLSTNADFSTSQAPFTTFAPNVRLLPEPTPTDVVGDGSGDGTGSSRTSRTGSPNGVSTGVAGSAASTVVAESRFGIAVAAYLVLSAAIGAAALMA